MVRSPHTLGHIGVHVYKVKVYNTLNISKVLFTSTYVKVSDNNFCNEKKVWAIWHLIKKLTPVYTKYLL